MAVHNLSSLIRKLVLRENSEKKSQNTESVDPKHIYVCLCLNDPNKNKSRIIGDCVPSQLYITSNNEQNYTLSLFIIVSDHIHHHLSLNTSHPHLPSKARVRCQRLCRRDQCSGTEAEWAMGDRSGIDEQLSHPNNESQATLILTTDLDLVSITESESRTGIRQ